VSGQVRDEVSLKMATASDLYSGCGTERMVDGFDDGVRRPIYRRHVHDHCLARHRRCLRQVCLPISVSFPTSVKTTLFVPRSSGTPTLLRPLWLRSQSAAASLISEG